MRHLPRHTPNAPKVINLEEFHLLRIYERGNFILHQIHRLVRLFPVSCDGLQLFLLLKVIGVIDSTIWQNPSSLRASIRD
jgi:hypothetical protein